MDNAIEISQSYFINKVKIKNKNKRRYNKIKRYEEVKKKKKSLIEEPYHSEERLEAIEFINEQIKIIKNKINRDTLIYSY